MAERPDEQQKGKAQEEAPPSLGEWIAAGLGLLLLVASIAFLLVDHWRGDGAPPAPAVRVLDVQPQSGRYLVRVEVTNASGGTAAALRVEGVLRRGGEEVERSEFELDYLPGRSTREGGLFFTHDPRSLTLDVQARSYQAP